MSARRRPQRSLFSPPVPPHATITAIIDGAARGNPGPAAYGVVFKDAAGKVRARLSARIGKTTNNVAEYHALLAALTYAHEQHWRALKVLTDSELLARQLEGSYKVRSPELKPLFQKAQQYIAALDYFAVVAVPRAQTREADRLANAALNARSVTRAPRPVNKRFNPAAPAAGRLNVRAVYEGGVLKNPANESSSPKANKSNSNSAANSRASFFGPTRPGCWPRNEPAAITH